MRHPVSIYAARIRNPIKRAYAWDVIRARANGLPDPADPAGLSLMGAQAVRLQIDAAQKKATE